ncbi:uncharacterized protein LOC141684932 [Apium graveolens]|uniref:uncharacterized protein LOC141684932 n=1 Tax=Apium graveolens TaxID=4045 RepID=UPI003D7B9A1B
MKTTNQENIKPVDGNDHSSGFGFGFDFAFGYKELHEAPLFVYADELFDSGMIKPLKVYEDSDPLIVKGKNEKFLLKKGSDHRKDSRSSSSSRVFELSPNFSANIQKERMEKSSLGSRSWSPSSSDWCKKWKLRDLLLFRSVSEGHASTKDDHGKKCRETVGFGFRDRSDFSEVKKGGERRRKKEGISAHERLYVKNRRAGEEMKRKTFLPYRKTLLIGCSDLDPGVYEYCKGHAVELKC